MRRLDHKQRPLLKNFFFFFLACSSRPVSSSHVKACVGAWERGWLPTCLHKHPTRLDSTCLDLVVSSAARQPAGRLHRYLVFEHVIP
ncbi:hypothetical protein BKA81DRAFT_359749, partial [Phyllosticta paracitricarpa]